MLTEVTARAGRVKERNRMAKVYKTKEGWRCEKKQDHLLRAQWMDYQDPSIMLLTLVTTDRMPLLGKLVRETIQHTPLGEKVAKEIERIPTYKGAESIEIYSYVVMPDHVHILLRIHDRLPLHLGHYIRWFKRQCTLACSDLGVTSPSDKLLPFAAEYHDRQLTHRGQLAHMARYIQDNPRRLALKRANKELFTIHQNIRIRQLPCTTLGNMFLADYPIKQVIKCSRSLTQEQIDEQKAQCLADAAEGVVHITGAISEGEKQIAQSLRENGYPLIVILHEGFPKPNDPHYRYYKPSGVYFEACAAGKLLLIEPGKEVLERDDIVALTEAKVGHIPHETQRYRFVAMNMIADEIARRISPEHEAN